MAEQKIEIALSDTNPGELKLTHNGHSGEHIDAHPFDRIVWELTDSRIYSFRIKIKPDSKNKHLWHFWNPPSEKPQHKRETAGVGAFAKWKEYKYYIYWTTDAKGTERRLDPIISIKPSGHVLTFIGFLPGVMALSSLIRWRMQRLEKNKALLQEAQK